MTRIPGLNKHWTIEAVCLLVYWLVISIDARATAIKSAPPTSPAPLQAELVAGFDARLLTTDEPIFAKVKEIWQGGDCILKKDALVKGRVVSARIHAGKSDSEVALLFESAECGGPGLKPVPLVLEAVLGPDSEAGRDTYVPLSQAIGLAPNPGGGIRGAGTAASIAMSEPDFGRPPVKIVPGTVSGISHMKLHVANGPEGSSVLSMAGRNLQLEARSVLVFMRSSLPSATTSEKPAAASPVVVPTATAVPVDRTPMLDEMEACIPPACNLTSAATEVQASGPQNSLSLSEFGFLTRPRQEMSGLDHDAAIAWLGSQELLVTFNPHTLVARNPQDGDRQGRTIRALLIGLPGLRVKRTLEWRVPDRNQYLWPAGQGRVIVHVGRELRVYGQGLQQERSLPIEKPLAFVRLSPSDTYMAIGLKQERHTRELHQQLEDSMGREPEEDVEIHVFNDHFEDVASATRPSKYAPPTLLEDGEVTFRATAKQQYRMVEVGWDHRVQTIANLHSVCVPEATSLPGGLLFLVSCDPSTSGKQYRVLRSNGKVLLKGFTSSQTIADLAEGNDAHNSFAIAEVVLGRSLAPGTVFVSGELKNEQLMVYRNEDGKRVFATIIDGPPPSCQVFALSPEGDRMAALAHGKLLISQFK